MKYFTGYSSGHGLYTIHHVDRGLIGFYENRQKCIDDCNKLNGIISSK